jgi:signal transduction histidine kinase
MKKEHVIVLVQDISKEIDAGEIDAIHRLLRILTHEIMNSLTPVHSLTETITMLMTDKSGQSKQQEQLSQKNYEDILESVQAIQERTGGLDHFVNKFRTLTRKPESLEKKTIAVRELLELVCKIMHVQLARTKVVLEAEPNDMQVTADSALMEQVLINLVTNSLTAMSETEHPLLTLKSFRHNDQIVIQVQDNGAGIPEEKLEDIFMPFYSTKQQASGIGLSFVKQILRLHNASIRVQSTVGQGSVFSISFNESDQHNH